MWHTIVRLLAELLAKPETTVTFYPYRTARVTHLFHQEGFMRGDEEWQIRERLALRSGKGMDNHTCYKVEHPDMSTIYIQIHDWNFSVGLGIRLGD